MIWTKEKLPQIDGDEISTAYSAPRLMTLEYQLNQHCRKNDLLGEIVLSIRKHLEKQAAVNDDVAGPFFLHPSRQMDFERLLTEPLAKTSGFDIYGPFMSGGMMRHSCPPK